MKKSMVEFVRVEKDTTTLTDKKNQLEGASFFNQERQTGGGESLKGHVDK